MLSSNGRDRAIERVRAFAQKQSQPQRPAPASVEKTLARAGAPLDRTLQRDIEQRFGYDFSRVRIYSDGEAAQSAEDVNANAYTVGHKIVFGEGRFAPASMEGRRLLAHELTHVAQQSGAFGVTRTGPMLAR